MLGKQAVARRMEAAAVLLEVARSLSPIPAALMDVYKPQNDIPEDMIKLVKRMGQ